MRDTQSGLRRGSDVAAVTSDGPIDAVLGDRSGYRKQLEQFIPAMTAVAIDAAANKRTLVAACFDGAPMRTLNWNPEEEPCWQSGRGDSAPA